MVRSAHIWCSAVARTRRHTIEVLETFDYPGTGNLTRPQKINDRGVIAGIYLDSSGVSRGFFRSRRRRVSAGRLLNLTIPANLTELRGVNNKRMLLR